MCVQCVRLAAGHVSAPAFLVPKRASPLTEMSLFDFFFLARIPYLCDGMKECYRSECGLIAPHGAGCGTYNLFLVGPFATAADGSCQSARLCAPLCGRAGREGSMHLACMPIFREDLCHLHRSISLPPTLCTRNRDVSSSRACAVAMTSFPLPCVYVVPPTPRWILPRQARSSFLSPS